MGDKKDLIMSILISILSLFIAPFLPFGETVSAQPLETIEIASSVNPVGSGARALGMGGAFIAVADDATAASWNPAGLIQLEKPEVSAVGAFFDRREDNSFGSHPEASGAQNVSKWHLNYLSAAYPFVLFKRNMIVSLNYQNLYDFERKWSFPLSFSPSGNPWRVDYRQSGSLSAIGLAYAVQIIPRLSLGVTVNRWDDDLSNNEWEQKNIIGGSDTDAGGDRFTFKSFIYDKYSVKGGTNFNIGLLWNITDKITLGAVYKTPLEADLKHRHVAGYSLSFPASLDMNAKSMTTVETNETLYLPMSYGLGLSYRFSDHLTVAADLYRTEWGDFKIKTAEGREISPITGRSIQESSVRPTHQVRLGGEYLFITGKYVIPARCGIFYDPAPATKHPDDYYGFSLGTGVGIGRFIFDIAYEFRYGRNVNSAIVRDMDFSQNVRSHTVYSSIIVHL
jgi:long-subunit fatty acid transport protein